MDQSGPTAVTKPERARDIGLDVLRSVAVWLVLFRHVEFPEGFHRAWLAPITFIKRGGWIGVDVFFVLSGFLVSGLLFKEYRQSRTVSIPRFLIRRGFKIYPAFWVMIGITLIVRHFFQHVEISFRGLLGEALFIQNYYHAIWGQTWSLAVEEHFYLLLALVSYLMVRKHAGSADPFRFIPAMFGLVTVTCFLLRWWTVHRSPWDLSWMALFPSHLRIDSLLFGVVISYWFHFRMTDRDRARLDTFRPVLLVVGTMLCLIPFVWDVLTTPWVTIIGLNLIYLGAGCLLLALFSARLSHNRLAVWSAWLGAYSYSVYLWHRAVQEWGEPFFKKFFTGDTRWILWTIYYLAGSWFFGVVLAKLIEMPVLRIRDFLFPSGVKGAAVATEQSIGRK